MIPVSITALLSHPLLFAAAESHGEDRVIIFFTQILLLIVVGRLLGEVMQRLGQPAVMGQLLGGIILGPSVFGAIWPSAQHAIYPLESSNRQMLSAVSELGILMLLLLTGMETDLALVKRVKRSAILTSAGGIILPFTCGYVMGEFLPDSLLPDPNRRLMTSLFLATALSISSVKIVAAVLREVDFLRRDLGQIILASSILDDTVGWVILSFIGGLAAHGTIVVGPLLISVFGTALFLLFCFTIGGSWIARLIRWTNDSFIIEMPVISVILVLMLALALTTSLIGVQAVLGAFMAGIMIGQSPILTKHIEEQLRGLIVAIFMPVFFGVAGLSIDLKVLANPQLAELTLLVIVIASIGKLGGAFLGSLLSGLSLREALAVGLGMNARGSTEIILATIGLSLGVLNQQLFTVIVLMAVATTLCMPPLLRWALSRVTVRDEEKKRLEKETAEEKELLPKIERILVGLEARDANGFAARLAGWLIGSRQISATALDWNPTPKKGDKDEATAPSEILVAAADEAHQNVQKQQKAKAHKARDDHPLAGAHTEETPEISTTDLVSILKPKEMPDEKNFAVAILAEAQNGYGMIFLGTGSTSLQGKFHDSLEEIVREFKGPVAILFEGKDTKTHDLTTLEKILVPTTGTDYSRFGAEIAVAIAKGCGASITAVHVAVASEIDTVRRSTRQMRTSRSLVADIEALGEREGVEVQPKALKGQDKERAILRQVEQGGHQLIVIGSKSQSSKNMHFGSSAMALIEHAPCPVLIVKS
jgi:Kef-type K+ transport system membrane component KefB/nucleotide-binding universal stress UspA family protein